MCVQNNYEKLCCQTLGTRYETTIASLAGHTYIATVFCAIGEFAIHLQCHSTHGGDSQRLEYWESKVDGLGVIYVSTILV